MEQLIPHSAFAAMPWPMLLLLLVGSIYYLMLGADWLVEGAAGLAGQLGMSKVIIGATIVSLGTTSPEAAVSVMAAWEGKAGLALGNAVGSIIADTGLIFGLGCVLMVLPADRFVLRRQGWVDISAAMLLAVVCYSVFAMHGDHAVLGRWVGYLFLALLAAYMLMSVRWSRQHSQNEPFDQSERQVGDRVKEKSKAALSGLILIGVVLVVFSSRFVIGSVEQLAGYWGVPRVVIAATLVAFGTSLPELIVGITALRRGHPELLVGNVIGADILNVLFVVGASALAAELPIVDLDAGIPRIFLYLHLPTMVLIIGLFLFYILRSSKRGHFQRWYGVPLLVLYFTFVIISWIAGMAEGGSG